MILIFDDPADTGFSKDCGGEVDFFKTFMEWSWFLMTLLTQAFQKIVCVCVWGGGGGGGGGSRFLQNLYGMILIFDDPADTGFSKAWGGSRKRW